MWHKFIILFLSLQPLVQGGVVPQKLIPHYRSKVCLSAIDELPTCNLKIFNVTSQQVMKLTSPVDHILVPKWLKLNFVVDFENIWNTGLRISGNDLVVHHPDQIWPKVAQNSILLFPPTQIFSLPTSWLGTENEKIVIQAKTCYPELNLKPCNDSNLSKDSKDTNEAEEFVSNLARQVRDLDRIAKKRKSDRKQTLYNFEPVTGHYELNEIKVDLYNRKPIIFNEKLANMYQKSHYENKMRLKRSNVDDETTKVTTVRNENRETSTGPYADEASTVTGAFRNGYTDDLTEATTLADKDFETTTATDSTELKAVVQFFRHAESTFDEETMLTTNETGSTEFTSSALTFTAAVPVEETTSDEEMQTNTVTDLIETTSSAPSFRHSETTTFHEEILQTTTETDLVNITSAPTFRTAVPVETTTSNEEITQTNTEMHSTEATSSLPSFRYTETITSDEEISQITTETDLANEATSSPTFKADVPVEATTSDEEITQTNTATDSTESTSSLPSFRYSETTTSDEEILQTTSEMDLANETTTPPTFRAAVPVEVTTSGEEITQTDTVTDFMETTSSLPSFRNTEITTSDVEILQTTIETDLANETTSPPTFRAADPVEVTTSGEEITQTNTVTDLTETTPSLPSFRNDETTTSDEETMQTATVTDLVEITSSAPSLRHAETTSSDEQILQASTEMDLTDVTTSAPSFRTAVPVETTSNEEIMETTLKAELVEGTTNVRFVRSTDSAETTTSANVTVVEGRERDEHILEEPIIDARFATVHGRFGLTYREISTNNMETGGQRMEPEFEETTDRNTGERSDEETL